MRCISSSMVVGVVLCAASGAVAGPVTLDASNRGWVWQNGTSGSDTSATADYYSGNKSGLEARNWFVFSLAGVGSPISGGELRLSAKSIQSDDPSETFQITSTATSANTLITASNSVAVFNSLGVGTLFSSITVVDGVHDHTTLVLTLNSAGLAEINANLGGQIAFSGRMTTLDASPFEFVFGSSVGGNTRLHLTDNPVVPLPSGAAMAMVGMGAVGLRRRRS